MINISDSIYVQFDLHAGNLVFNCMANLFVLAFIFLLVIIFGEMFAHIYIAYEIKNIY